MTHHARRLIKTVAVILVTAMVGQDLAYAAPVAPDFSGWSVRGGRKESRWPKVRFRVPEAAGFIEDGYRAPGGSEKLIILVQDTHANPSAQLNSARILAKIFRAENIRTVFTEAAQGDVTLSSHLSTDADRTDVRRSAEAILRKGRLAGFELADLTAPGTITLWGVEDEKLYAQALELYRSAASERRQALLFLDRAQRTAETLADELLTGELQDLRLARAAHETGAISTVEYFGALSDAGSKRGLSLAEYLHLGLLRKLAQEEKNFNFETITDEQDDALSALPEADRTALGVLARDAGAAAQSAYWAAAREDGAVVRRGSALERYLVYLGRCRELDAPAVMDELDRLEREVVDRLAPSEDARTLMEVIRNLGTLKDLITLKATPSEFSRYVNERAGHDVTRLTAFMNAKIHELGRHYDQAVFLDDVYDAAERSAQKFYELSTHRDAAMIQNLTARMDATGQTRAVLVAGGYHAPGLERELRTRGISYLSIIPAGTEPTDTALYEKMLLSQTTAPAAKTTSLPAVKYVASRSGLMLRPLAAEARLGDPAATATLQTLGIDLFSQAVTGGRDAALGARMASTPDLGSILGVLNGKASSKRKLMAASKIVSVPEFKKKKIKFGNWKKAILALEVASRSRNKSVRANAEASLVELFDDDLDPLSHKVIKKSRKDPEIRQAIYRIIRRESIHWNVRWSAMELMGRKAFATPAGRSALRAASKSADSAVAEAAKLNLARLYKTSQSQSKDSGARMAEAPVTFMEGAGGYRAIADRAIAVFGGSEVLPEDDIAIDRMMLAADLAIQALQAAVGGNEESIREAGYDISPLIVLLAATEARFPGAFGALPGLITALRALKDPHLTRSNYLLIRPALEALVIARERVEVAMRIIKHEGGAYDLVAGTITSIYLYYKNYSDLMRIADLVHRIQRRIGARKEKRYSVQAPIVSYSEAARWRSLIEAEMTTRPKARTKALQTELNQKHARFVKNLRMYFWPMISGIPLSGETPISDPIWIGEMKKSALASVGLKTGKFVDIRIEKEAVLWADRSLIMGSIEVMLKNSLLVAKERLEDENEKRRAGHRRLLTWADRPVKLTVKVTRDETGAAVIDVVELSDNVGGVTDAEALQETYPGSGRQKIMELNFSRRKKDTGFGLAFVWHVIHMHGGTLKIENLNGRPGTGIRAVIRLPAKPTGARMASRRLGTGAFDKRVSMKNKIQSDGPHLSALIRGGRWKLLRVWINSVVYEVRFKGMQYAVKFASGKGGPHLKQDADHLEVLAADTVLRERIPQLVETGDSLILNSSVLKRSAGNGKPYTKEVRRVYMITRMIPGMNLDQKRSEWQRQIKRDPFGTRRDVLSAFAAAAEALEEFSDHGWIKGDLGRNEIIWNDQTGKVSFVDFGASRKKGRESRLDDSITLEHDRFSLYLQYRLTMNELEIPDPIWVDDKLPAAELGLKAFISRARREAASVGARMAAVEAVQAADFPGGVQPGDKEALTRTTATAQVVQLRQGMFGLGLRVWDKRVYQPFTEAERQAFETSAGLETLEQLPDDPAEIVSVRQSTYDRSSGGTEIRIIVRTTGGRDHFVRLVNDGSDTTAFDAYKKKFQPKFTSLAAPHAAAQASFGNLGDMRGYTAWVPESDNRWRFIAGSDEAPEGKKYRAVVEYLHGRRALGIVRMESNADGGGIQLFFTPEGSLVETPLNAGEVKFVMSAFVAGWGEEPPARLLAESYTGGADLRHVLALPMVSRSGFAFYKALSASPALLSAAIRREPVELPLDADASGAGAEAILSKMDALKYRRVATADAVRSPGDYFVSDGRIRMIFLPGIYPVNTLVVSRDGRQAAFVSVQGRSGFEGADYSRLLGWIQSDLKLPWAYAVFILDNGKDPSIRLLDDGSYLTQGRPVVNAALSAVPLLVPEDEARSEAATRERIGRIREAVLERVIAMKSDEGTDEIGEWLASEASKNGWSERAVLKGMASAYADPRSRRRVERIPFKGASSRSYGVDKTLKETAFRMGFDNNKINLEFTKARIASRLRYARRVTVNNPPYLGSPGGIHMRPSSSIMRILSDAADKYGVEAYFLLSKDGERQIVEAYSPLGSIGGAIEHDQTIRLIVSADQPTAGLKEIADVLARLLREPLALENPRSDDRIVPYRAEIVEIMERHHFVPLRPNQATPGGTGARMADLSDAKAKDLRKEIQVGAGITLSTEHLRRLADLAPQDRSPDTVIRIVDTQAVSPEQAGKILEILYPAKQRAAGRDGLLGRRTMLAILVAAGVAGLILAVVRMMRGRSGSAPELLKVPVRPTREGIVAAFEFLVDWMRTHDEPSAEHVRSYLSLLKRSTNMRLSAQVRVATLGKFYAENGVEILLNPAAMDRLIGAAKRSGHSSAMIEWICSLIAREAAGADFILRHRDSAVKMVKVQSEIIRGLNTEPRSDPGKELTERAGLLRSLMIEGRSAEDWILHHMAFRIAGEVHEDLAQRDFLVRQQKAKRYSPADLDAVSPGDPGDRELFETKHRVIRDEIFPDVPLVERIATNLALAIIHDVRAMHTGSEREATLNQYAYLIRAPREGAPRLDFDRLEAAGLLRPGRFRELAPHLKDAAAELLPRIERLLDEKTPAPSGARMAGGVSEEKDAGSGARMADGVLPAAERFILNSRGETMKEVVARYRSTSRLDNVSDLDLDPLQWKFRPDNGGEKERNRLARLTLEQLGEEIKSKIRSGKMANWSGLDLTIPGRDFLKAFIDMQSSNSGAMTHHLFLSRQYERWAELGEDTSMVSAEEWAVYEAYKALLQEIAARWVMPEGDHKDDIRDFFGSDEAPDLDTYLRVSGVELAANTDHPEQNLLHSFMAMVTVYRYLSHVLGGSDTAAIVQSRNEKTGAVHEDIETGSDWMDQHSSSNRSQILFNLIQAGDDEKGFTITSAVMSDLGEMIEDQNRKLGPSKSYKTYRQYFDRLIVDFAGAALLLSTLKLDKVDPDVLKRYPYRAAKRQRASGTQQELAVVPREARGLYLLNRAFAGHEDKLPDFNRARQIYERLWEGSVKPELTKIADLPALSSAAPPFVPDLNEDLYAATMRPESATDQFTNWMDLGREPLSAGEAGFLRRFTARVLADQMGRITGNDQWQRLAVLREGQRFCVIGLRILKEGQVQLMIGGNVIFEDKAESLITLAKQKDDSTDARSISSAARETDQFEKSLSRGVERLQGKPVIARHIQVRAVELISDDPRTRRAELLVLLASLRWSIDQKPYGRDRYYIDPEGLSQGEVRLLQKQVNLRSGFVIGPVDMQRLRTDNAVPVMWCAKASSQVDGWVNILFPAAGEGLQPYGRAAYLSSAAVLGAVPNAGTSQDVWGDFVKATEFSSETFDQIRGYYGSQATFTKGSDYLEAIRHPDPLLQASNTLLSHLIRIGARLAELQKTLQQIAVMA